MSTDMMELVHPIHGDGSYTFIDTVSTTISNISPKNLCSVHTLEKLGNQSAYDAIHLTPYKT